MVDQIKEIDTNQKLIMIGDAADLEMEEVCNRINAIRSNLPVSSDGKIEIHQQEEYLAQLRAIRGVADYFNNIDNAHASLVKNIIEKGRERFAKAQEIVQTRTSLGEQI